MEWNLESEYASQNSDVFLSDEKYIKQNTENLKLLITQIKPIIENAENINLIQEIILLEQETLVLCFNLKTYLKCQLSVNALDTQAKTKLSQVMSLSSDFESTIKSVHLFLSTCGQAYFDQVFSHEKLKSSKFIFEQERLKKDSLLSESEETLIIALEQDGFTSWSNLYDTLSGKIRVKIEFADQVKVIGIAEASGLLKSPNAVERKAAWHGLQNAWKDQQETAASILNSLAGWRLKINEKRSYKQDVHFLQAPLFENRIKAETLTAMNQALHDNLKQIRPAVLMMAKMYNQEKLNPWDLLAPSPLELNDTPLTLNQGLEIIKKAFAGVSPEFAQFVQMMQDNQWIEGRILPNKINGAYCTGFQKSKTPRVFMTYLGSTSDVSTLAHELGHAYHSWVMRDLDLSEKFYPMTLAETASIFAETVLADEMIQQANTKSEKIKYAWSEIENAVALLINISARFEFEKNFYELRKNKVVSASELSELMDQAWSKWYGETLNQNDQLFWATKLHFSISKVSFYNFPYTFGYLFALSIYARRAKYGESFMPKYIEILRDTGRMSAEDLIQKHLGEDITKPQFWQKSIDVVIYKIKNFKNLVESDFH